MARTRKSKTQTESSSTEPQQETDDTTWPEADQVQDAVILEEADQVGVPEEPQADTEDATPVELDEPERADGEEDAVGGDPERGIGVDPLTLPLPLRPQSRNAPAISMEIAPPMSLIEEKEKKNLINTLLKDASSN